MLKDKYVVMITCITLLKIVEYKYINRNPQTMSDIIQEDDG